LHHIGLLHENSNAALTTALPLPLFAIAPVMKFGGRWYEQGLLLLGNPSYLIYLFQPHVGSAVLNRPPVCPRRGTMDDGADRERCCAAGGHRAALPPQAAFAEMADAAYETPVQRPQYWLTHIDPYAAGAFQ
jgi:hypothetical protein